MRFSDIKPTEFMVNDDGSGDFILETTGELMNLANSIRRKAGMTDIVTAEADNGVWYNFYLVIDVKKQTGEIWFTSNNSEKDDWKEYRIPVSDTERKALFDLGLGKVPDKEREYLLDSQGIGVK